MVHETPELYKRIVLPYIEAFPASRTQWYEFFLNSLLHSQTLQQGRRHLIWKVRSREDSPSCSLTRIWLRDPPRHEMGPHHHPLTLPRRDRAFKVNTLAQRSPQDPSPAAP